MWSVSFTKCSYSLQAQEVFFSNAHEREDNSKIQEVTC